MKLSELDRLHMTGHEDDEPEPTIERNGRVTLIAYSDGERSWEIRGLNRGESRTVNNIIDGALEDAYEMGQQSMREQIGLLKSALTSAIKERDEAYGKGVIDAAKTAYGGKR